METLPRTAGRSSEVLWEVWRSAALSATEAKLNPCHHCHCFRFSNCFSYLGEGLTPWAVQLKGCAFRIVLWCALSLHLHDVNTSVPMSLTNGLARKLIDVRFSDSVLFKPLQLANQHNLKLILNSWVIGRNRITLSTPCCSSWAFASNWDAPWSSLGFEGRQSKSHHRLLGEVPWLSRLSVLWSKKTRWR